MQQDVVVVRGQMPTRAAWPVTAATAWDAAGRAETAAAAARAAARKRRGRAAAGSTAATPAADPRQTASGGTARTAAAAETAGRLHPLPCSAACCLADTCPPPPRRLRRPPATTPPSPHCRCDGGHRAAASCDLRGDEGTRLDDAGTQRWDGETLSRQARDDAEEHGAGGHWRQGRQCERRRKQREEAEQQLQAVAAMDRDDGRR